jgi:hypothetical protein
VFAVFGSHDCVTRMMLIGRRDPNDVDFRIRTQFLNGRIRSAAILLPKGIERFAAQIRRRDDIRV